MGETQYPKYDASYYRSCETGIVIVECTAGSGWDIAVLVGGDGLDASGDCDDDCFARYADMILILVS